MGYLDHLKNYAITEDTEAKRKALLARLTPISSFVEGAMERAEAFDKWTYGFTEKIHDPKLRSAVRSTARIGSRAVLGIGMVAISGGCSMIPTEPSGLSTNLPPTPDNVPRIIPSTFMDAGHMYTPVTPQTTTDLSSIGVSNSCYFENRPANEQLLTDKLQTLSGNIGNIDLPSGEYAVKCMIDNKGVGPVDDEGVIYFQDKKSGRTILPTDGKLLEAAIDTSGALVVLLEIPPPQFTLDDINKGLTKWKDVKVLINEKEVMGLEGTVVFGSVSEENSDELLTNSPYIDGKVNLKEKWTMGQLITDPESGKNPKLLVKWTSKNDGDSEVFLLRENIPDSSEQKFVYDLLIPVDGKANNSGNKLIIENVQTGAGENWQTSIIKGDGQTVMLVPSTLKESNENNLNMFVSYKSDFFPATPPDIVGKYQFVNGIIGSKNTKFIINENGLITYVLNNGEWIKNYALYGPGSESNKSKIQTVNLTDVEKLISDLENFSPPAEFYNNPTVVEQIQKSNLMLERLGFDVLNADNKNFLQSGVVIVGYINNDPKWTVVALDKNNKIAGWQTRKDETGSSKLTSDPLNPNDGEREYAFRKREDMGLIGVGSELKILSVQGQNILFEFRDNKPFRWYDNTENKFRIIDGVLNITTLTLSELNTIFPGEINADGKLENPERVFYYVKALTEDIDDPKDDKCRSVLGIAADHVATYGTNANKIMIDYKDAEEYEYHNLTQKGVGSYPLVVSSPLSKFHVQGCYVKVYNNFIDTSGTSGNYMLIMYSFGKPILDANGERDIENVTDKEDVWIVIPTSKSYYWNPTKNFLK